MSAREWNQVRIGSKKSFKRQSVSAREWKTRWNEQFADGIKWLGYSFKAYLSRSLKLAQSFHPLRCVSQGMSCEMLTYLIWLVILKPTTDSLFSPTDSIVIVSSTSGSVANTLTGNLQTPPEAADIINWVLWLEEQTTKSSISDSRNLLQLLLTSDNHNYNSIKLETDWGPAVLLKWWTWPLMVLDNVCKTVLRVTEENHMCFFYLPKWLEWWKDEVEHKNHHSWHLILDLSQQTHAQGSFKTRLAFCVLVNKFVPTREGMAPF